MIPCFDNHCEGEFMPEGTAWGCSRCKTLLQMHEMVAEIFKAVFPNRAKDKAFIQFTAKQKSQEAQSAKRREGTTSGIVEA